MERCFILLWCLPETVMVRMRCSREACGTTFSFIYKVNECPITHRLPYSLSNLRCTECPGGLPQARLICQSSLLRVLALRSGELWDVLEEREVGELELGMGWER